ncbi:MAG: helix-turn-helix domain-containing protein [Magnetococcales bacterium]|nr:helix-turn-helix domain-containing protein [Magnetococcales bacterium]MBF0113440.1 helix-turn-helix domain-containing protein [Magnetococcales bacterium]
MNFGERISAARKNAKFTQKELADRVGISQTAVHKLEKNRSKSSRRTVTIALVCGVDPIWLETGRGEVTLGGARPGMSAEELNHAVEGGELRRTPLFARLPRISWEEAARLCADPAGSFYPASVETWLPIAPKTSDKAFALAVPDDSMEPEFSEGEVIVLDPLQKGKHNHFIVARMAGEGSLTFKQLMVVGNKKFLKPLNQRYPLLEVDEGMSVCGVVVAKFKEYPSK